MTSFTSNGFAINNHESRSMPITSKQDNKQPSFSWGGLLNDQANSMEMEFPKFKSFAPPLPLSTAPASPASSFLDINQLSFSPSVFLDSPAFLSNSNFLTSPSIGAFSGLAFRGEERSFPAAPAFSNFQSQSQTKPEATSSSVQSSANILLWQESSKRQQEEWNFNKQIETEPLSHEKSGIKSEFASSAQRNHNNMHSNVAQQSAQIHYAQPSQLLREHRRAEDGYNWRKYGQKQVKGSENPRSYYKCSHPNCPTKKQVERNSEGYITEIVYRGNHNHSKPQSTRRSSSSHSIPSSSYSGVELLENGRMESSSIIMPENSSVSFGEDEFDQGSPTSKSGDDSDVAKRWKRENGSELISASGSRTVREPRIVVQTTSDIDILDDGFRWRKYGQKVVKGNPNPRSYYKCTHAGCPVRKHVERAAHDTRAVITTYEGKHSHDVPAARGSGNYNVSNPFPSNGNITAPMTATLRVRPSAITNNPSLNQSTNYSNTLRNNTRLHTTQTNHQVPYTLQMLQSPDGNFEFLSFGNSAEAGSGFSNKTQQHMMNNSCVQRRT